MSNKVVVVKEYQGGDLFIEIPDDVLKTLDGKPGDMITWVLNDDGTVTLKRQYRKEPEQPDIFGD